MTHMSFCLTHTVTFCKLNFQSQKSIVFQHFYFRPVTPNVIAQNCTHFYSWTFCVELHFSKIKSFAEFTTVGSVRYKCEAGALAIILSLFFHFRPFSDTVL